MGWYDAYKPTNVSRAYRDSVAGTTSNTGNAVGGLGDAFTKIGNSMLKVDKARDDEKTNKALRDYRNAYTTKVDHGNSVQKEKDKQSETNKTYLNSMNADGVFTAPVDGVDLITRKQGLNFSKAFKKDKAAKNDKAFLKIIPQLDGSENKKLLRDHLYDGGKDSAFKDVSVNALNTLNNSINADVKAENYTKQQRDALKEQEKEIKQEAEKERLKIKLEKQQHEKPLSPAAQNSYMKSLDQDLYITDINGNKTPKEGISQKQIDFLEGAVNQYMTSHNSDRNIYKAKKHALDLWKNSKEYSDEQKGQEKQTKKVEDNHLQTLMKELNMSTN